MNNSQEESLLEERKKKTLDFLKKKYDFVTYSILAILVIFSYWIRTLNLSGLRDITTGGWALGPDLDPWLFTRWAKEIIENGALTAIDSMRYVPLGFETKGELIFLPYLMAWFHKFASLFGSASVEQSSALFPAFMFALTIIPLFLFVKQIFVNSLGSKKANIIGLLSSFFFIILPPLLPRTVAGIPEKESAAFFFMFFALYFFLLAWKSEDIKKLVIFALLAGASTAGMSLIWGGVAYVYFTISVSVLIAFFLKQFDNKKIFIPLIWLVSSYIIVAPFTERFSALSFFTSTSSLITFLAIISFIIYNYLNKKRISLIEDNPYLSKIPKTLLAFGIILIIGFILSLVIFGPEFIKFQFHQIVDNLVTPITSRLGVTVAENRQPFFTEWANSFGPLLLGTPILFWLFCIGSVFLVSLVLKNFEKREKTILVSTYIIFLIALVFSRYKPDSILNGTNTISLIIYPIGAFILILLVGLYIYYLMHKNNSDDKLKELDFGIISLLVLFLLCIVSARGAVRLILMLVPPASILVSYLAVEIFYRAFENKDSQKTTFNLIIASIVIFASLYSAYAMYDETYNTSKNYVPNIYNQQWQYSMSWVRENTPKDAVFAHWWDYGYWVQSIGNRATVLDGGNAISYWNHLMGRYALTGPSNDEALEFLYSHNVTHFLIDSTDIGKYGAFSSIGSDAQYDRQSYIPLIGRDPQQKQETKNGTIYVYNAGFTLDGDLIYNQNGSRIFLPKGKAGLGIVTIELGKSGEILSQPHGIFVYQNKQYDIPLRYAYKDKLIDFKSGLDATAYIVPVFNGQSVDSTGSMIYLSPRTANSQLARLYLYHEENSFFKVVHTEDDFLVKELKKAGLSDKDFVVANGGIRGPITIWEVSYPSGINVNQDYLRTTYPSQDIEFA